MTLLPDQGKLTRTGQRSKSDCSISAMAAKESYVLIPVHRVFDFVKRCMVATEVSSSHATDLANLLVAADRRGHFSHGINRLGKNNFT